uniref:Uncharacterized protein n=1 Tax=Yersinia pseudotuberculosis serotype O:3 (strain YPIII) TaxID=502800 RepID=A0A0H3B1Q3_YERPY
MAVHVSGFMRNKNVMRVTFLAIDCPISPYSSLPVQLNP